MSVTPEWCFEVAIAESEQLLLQIADRLYDGEPATDLVNSIQSIWSNCPKGTTITAEQSAQLTVMLNQLNETVTVGEKWMSQATDVLGQINRGRKMMKDYQM